MKVPEIYKNGEYSSKDMFSPPAERKTYVIRFELTQGCPWGRCTYCCGFDGTKYREKDLPEYTQHVDRVFKALSSDVSRIKRVFIGGGDALAVETPKLVSAVNYTKRAYKQNTDGSSSLRRLAVYGSTRSITHKSIDELKAVKRAGINLVYWGIESGSNEVLEYVDKGCTGEEVLDAAKKINNAGIDTSVMIMPGLGGLRPYHQHITETSKVLSALQPKFITFMGINADPKSAYARRMKREKIKGTNRPLTPAETILQMAAIIRSTNSYKSGATVGCFAPYIDGVGCNPLPFGSFKIRYSNGMFILKYDQEVLSDELVRRCRELNRERISQATVIPVDYISARLGQITQELVYKGSPFVLATDQNGASVVKNTRNPFSRKGISVEQDKKNPAIFRIKTTPQFLMKAVELEKELVNLYVADVRIETI